LLWADVSVASAISATNRAITAQVNLVERPLSHRERVAEGRVRNLNPREIVSFIRPAFLCCPTFSPWEKDARGSFVSREQAS